AVLVRRLHPPWRPHGWRRRGGRGHHVRVACGGGATLRHREGDRGDTPARGAAELRSRHARARPASTGGAPADGAPAPPPPAAGRRGVVASGTIAGPTWQTRAGSDTTRTGSANRSWRRSLLGPPNGPPTFGEPPLRDGFPRRRVVRKLRMRQTNAASHSGDSTTRGVRQCVRQERSSGSPTTRASA